MIGISIHALREEGDARPAFIRWTSTDFYPRPPQGGRRDGSAVAQHIPGISIHALREEGDKQAPETTTGGIAFLSTPSARRATVQRDSVSVSGHISIHALREEGDSIGRLPHRHNRNFYPRPPRGGRPDGYARCFPWPGISIHALREEGDRTSSGGHGRDL